MPCFTRRRSRQNRDDNDIRSKPIFEILSTLERELNFQQNSYKIFYHDLTLLPHDFQQIKTIQISQFDGFVFIGTVCSVCSRALDAYNCVNLLEQ